MLRQSIQNDSLGEQKRVDQGDLLSYGCADFILGHTCLVLSCPEKLTVAGRPDTA
jgi:hypothetical protein